MWNKLNRWAFVTLFACAVVALACSGTDEDAAAEAERDAQWQQIQDQKAQLDDLRAQLAAAREAEASAGGEGEGEAAASADGPSVEQLEAQVDEASQEFTTALVGFINDNPLLEGVEPTERQRAALRMKSSEDMLIAEEYIEEGGDYRQALQIYKLALLTDPDNDELQAAMERAEEMRYMSEERFSAVKNGMTQEEVRAEIGIPHHANRRNFEERGVQAWFYPVDAQGSAAAVYFRERGGNMVVYQSNYREVVKEGPTEAGE